jgi:hypothetical protein
VRTILLHGDSKGPSTWGAPQEPANPDRSDPSIRLRYSNLVVVGQASWPKKKKVRLGVSVKPISEQQLISSNGIEASGIDKGR